MAPVAQPEDDASQESTVLDADIASVPRVVHPDASVATPVADIPVLLLLQSGETLSSDGASSPHASVAAASCDDASAVTTAVPDYVTALANESLCSREVCMKSHDTCLCACVICTN